MTNALRTILIGYFFFAIGISQLAYAKTKSTNKLSARKKNQFIEIEYKVVRRDTFGKILKRFVKIDSVIKNTTPMVIKTRRKNKHVKNWNRLIIGQTIKLYINGSMMDPNKWKKYQKSILGVNEQQDGKKGFQASVFYMASTGSFKQVSEDDGVDIDFEQNSNASIGISTMYSPKRKRYSYSASLYWSALSATATNIGQVEVPSEIGGNMYFQYPFKKIFGLSYAGLDFEKFATYNTEGLSRPKERTLIINNNFVSYLTIGHAALFTIFKKNIFAKISLSKSIMTSTTVQGDALTPVETYSGYKIFTYLNYKLGKNFFLHGIAKYHSMTGPDQLTVTRLGLGFGYILK